MKPVPTLQRIALAGTIAISGLMGVGSLASAQDSPDFDPDYYESQLTGYEIEIDGDEFVIDDVIYQEYDDGENEQVYIESDYSSSQVSFFDDSDAPEDTIELWLSDLGEGMDSLDVVENGEDGDVIWYYAEGVYDDLDFAYYIQVTEDVDGNVDVLESVLTLEGGLVDAIEAAQQDISIDGESFMDDVDLDELEDFLGGEGTFRGTGDDADDDSTRTGSDDSDRDRDQDDDEDSDRDRDRGQDDEDSSTTRDRERLPAGDDEDDDSGDDTNGTDDSTTNDNGEDDTGN